MPDLTRVLHVVVNMNRGGAETLIMNIYRNIDRSRVQFDFLVHKREGAYEKEIMELGGRIYRIPYVTDIGHFRYIRALRSFFAEHTEYKIVHAHMDCMSGLVIEAAKKEGVPVRIAHSHNTQSEGNIPARLYKEYACKRIIPNATRLCACSEAAAVWLFGKQSINSLIVKNGIDVVRFLYNSENRINKRKELGIGSDITVIGHVGRFCHQKNHSFLIDVFSEVKKKEQGSLLLLVGDGPLKTDIMLKAEKLGLKDSVFFLGVRSDIPELLQAMDVMLFPSHHEGLPLTIIEAQASGLRCIVSDAINAEADIGADLLTFVSLKKGSGIWADETLKVCSCKTGETLKAYGHRRETGSLVGKSGYNIAATTEKILDLYKGCTVEAGSRAALTYEAGEVVR